MKQVFFDCRAAIPNSADLIRIERAVERLPRPRPMTSTGNAVFGSETATDEGIQERCMMNNQILVDAYHEAVGDYEAAKACAGNRVEMFTRFLVAERVLTARLGRVDPNLEQFQNPYSL